MGQIYKPSERPPLHEIIRTLQHNTTSTRIRHQTRLPPTFDLYKTEVHSVPEPPFRQSNPSELGHYLFPVIAYYFHLWHLRHIPVQLHNFTVIDCVHPLTKPSAAQEYQAVTTTSTCTGSDDYPLAHGAFVIYYRFHHI